MIICTYLKTDGNGTPLPESKKLLEMADSLRAESHGSLVFFEDLSLEETEAAVRENVPDVLLFASDSETRDMAARLAVRLGTGISSECFDVKYDEEKDLARFIRPVYDNSMLAETQNSKAKPQIGLMRIVTQDPSLSWTEDIPIEESEIVVCAGRGCGNGEGLELVKELARTLGAAVGATRAVTDAGWLPISKQIGQTGKYIHPRIYIGVGVGGAIQHLAGMRNSDVIIAVNKDPRAPIFEQADYGVVGDLYTVLPLMIKAFREINSK